MVPLRVPYQQNFFFIICFYVIMHRTTIVQNKIISIICSFFFYLANIFRPSQGKVRLGTQTYLNHSIFISEGKKTFYSELYALQCIAVRF